MDRALLAVVIAFITVIFVIQRVVMPYIVDTYGAFGVVLWIGGLLAAARVLEKA